MLKFAYEALQKTAKTLDRDYFYRLGGSDSYLHATRPLFHSSVGYNGIMNLSTPISSLFLVGPTYAKRLKKLGIQTVEDLLYHFPFRYLDYSIISSIGQLQVGETATARGKILSLSNKYTSRGKKIQKGTVVDKTGSFEVVWFNQPFLLKVLKPGTPLSLSGKVDFWGREKAMISPEYELLKAPPSFSQPDPQLTRLPARQATHDSPSTIHTGRLVPVYHETYGVSSKWLRSRIAPLIKKTIPFLNDFLPEGIKEKYELMDPGEALTQIHFPQDTKTAKRARKRFAFEELFLLQLLSFQRKKSWQKKKLAYRLRLKPLKIKELIRQLPFELTGAQKRVLREILPDLAQDQPMNRLLQGDVGSGKTIVAAAACYLAFLNGLQSALMAPTEILANQHYQTLSEILTPLGMKISLLTGSQRKKEENFDLLVGTHALIHKRGRFKKLGLVVIDEQQRFGVEQRSRLIQKGQAPHVLTMTATPIPRSIALTLYGDLNLSVIDELPKGRKKVKTWVVPPLKRQAAYQWIRKQVKNTPHQAFIICPLIEESAHETMQSVRAAKTEFSRLQKEIFPDLKLGLLHGRLKAKEKDKVLANLKKGQTDILVSTPVVEVGIDIPTATIMMIEAAERFGLSQLHQLRGRVGRGTEQSYCLLFTELRSGETLKRLKALEKTHIGIQLAELDLQLRGPGEVYGTRQHGFANLKVASFHDLPLIEQARKAASQLTTHNPSLSHYPLLQVKLKKVTIKNIEPN